MRVGSVEREAVGQEREVINSDATDYGGSGVGNMGLVEHPDAADIP